ncbi:uncharacterized protein LOC8035937 isoform X1 [Ixodes scapularis]|uniref:uncharacterized protein LOC8035937 isoform X1 n=1 Tax=Ixodes scapularis TaxID=6945 RepID=UPI001161A465|nr:uncharacterized protein LOC8035937 isoform X1 [Ixodes scapularis]
MGLRERQHRPMLPMLPSVLVAYFCVVCLNGVPRASAIEITKLTVPRVVESGLEGPFDLDCQYRCNESDSKLVVKWFFNGEPQPFYQWIAEMQKPVVAERYEQSLDMDRSHAPGGADACNTHTWQLRLVKPTIDMSGKYRCEVLTLDDQDSAEASMMVFAPPSTFHFNYTKSSSDRATLLCEVDGAFPMPHLKMYRLLVDSEDDQAELVNVQLTTERKEGYYRAVMTSEVMDNALPQDEATVFLCSYSFKEIKYQRLKRLTYMPGRPIRVGGHSARSMNRNLHGSPPETDEDGSNSSQNSKPILWLVFLCLYFGLS